MISTVLFDLDGTVINTNELVIASWKHALKTHLGICPEDREIINSFGEPLIDTAKRYDRDNAEEICITYRKFNMSVHDEMISGYEGMEEAIKRLKSLGFKVGIVTSKRKETAKRALEIFNLIHLMDIIVALEDTVKHKPEPDPLLKAFSMLNISPDEALYVGDSHYDILCGKNAGCSTCAVKYSAIPIDDLLKYKPDYTIDKPLDLLILVGENMQANAV